MGAVHAGHEQSDRMRGSLLAEDEHSVEGKIQSAFEFEIAELFGHRVARTPDSDSKSAEHLPVKRCKLALPISFHEHRGFPHALRLKTCDHLD